jgi:hypothetical protein
MREILNNYLHVGCINRSKDLALKDMKSDTYSGTKEFTETTEWSPETIQKNGARPAKP